MTGSEVTGDEAERSSGCSPKREDSYGPHITKAVLLLLLLTLAGCGEADEIALPVGPEDPGVIHIHGLGRNPADGALMVATHSGLFRVGANGGEPERVGDDYQDTMGFSVVGPDHFLGSGHPGSVADDPPFLGLIESQDAGETWRPVSLRGKVDFHALEVLGDTVYGLGSDFDSREARFLRSGDRGRSWTRLGAPEDLLGLAIDPADPERIVALGEKRGYISRDGGSRWRPLGVEGGFVTWSEEVGLIAVGLDGAVRQASQPDREWEKVGQIPGTPAALDAVGGEVLVATHESQVLSSQDGGKSFRTLLKP